MKTFKIPIFWQESAEIDVQANSLDEAIRMVGRHEENNIEGLEEAMFDGDYIDGSLEVNVDCARVLNDKDGYKKEVFK